MRKSIPFGFGLMALGLFVLFYVSIIYWWPPFVAGLIIIFYKGEKKNVTKTA